MGTRLCSTSVQCIHGTVIGEHAEVLACRGVKTDLIMPAAKLTSSKVEFVVQVCNGFLFPTAPTVQVVLLLSMSGWYSVHHLCMDG